MKRFVLQMTMDFSKSNTTCVTIQVDAIVSSVNRMGVFADVGPLPVFISNHVSEMLNCYKGGNREAKFI